MYDEILKLLYFADLPEILLNYPVKQIIYKVFLKNNINPSLNVKIFSPHPYCSSILFYISFILSVYVGSLYSQFSILIRFHFYPLFKFPKFLHQPLAIL